MNTYSEMSAQMRDNSTAVGEYWSRFTNLDPNVEGMADKLEIIRERMMALNEAFISGKKS